MKRKSRIIVSIMLCVVMFFGALPINAENAVDSETKTEQTAEIQLSDLPEELKYSEIKEKKLKKRE